MKQGPLSKILLVEDDPTVRCYLISLCTDLPAQVDAAANLAEALAHAQARAYDLFLIDANLPDGPGIELLSRLRRLWSTTVALAHTADQDPTTTQSLRAAGFLDVLSKPVNPQRWKAALRAALDAQALLPTLPMADALQTKPPLWDDATAARALGGSLANITALRRLFLTELSIQLVHIRDGDQTDRRRHLHRLHASCAFVGALRLEAAVRAFDAAPTNDQKLRSFLETAQATLESAARFDER